MFDWWTAWWGALAGPDQFFWAIALVTSALLLLQILLSLLGFDHDADLDADTDVDHGDGSGVLSFRTVTAFLAGFGWGGVIAMDQGFSVFASTVIALATGGAMMAMVYFLMRVVYSLRYSGNLDYQNAVGLHGSVYLPIPPSMQGLGQIEILVQGRLATVQAMTRASDRIPNRARVRVVEQLDPQTLLVEPLDSAPASERPAEASI